MSLIANYADNLPEPVLAKRALLSEKPLPIQLKGQFVWLEPLIVERDAQRLYEISNGQAFQLGKRVMETYDPDQLIWRYMFEGPFKSCEAFIASLQAQVNASNGLCMSVFDVTSGSPIGVANFMNNFPSHLKIELGGIWYSPIAQKSSANTEATYLMLKHCFELGYRRVEWKCHSQNDRSRRAALRMGFKFEGIQESHLIVKDCNRDTAWFRILDSEWPDIRKDLEQFLY